MSTYILRYHGIRRLSTSITSLLKNINIPFARSLDTVESSVHTMEKILTILQDAESASQEEQVAASETKEDVVEKSFSQRFFHSLGNDVFDYKVIQVLNSLQIINQYDVFQHVSPETTKNIYGQYLAIFKDRYLRKLDPDTDALEKLGRQFGELPLPTLASLTSKLSKLSSSLLVDGAELPKREPFKFDFTDILFYQPFKLATADPLVLRKGLSMGNHPLNLLATMVNDEDVVKTFLKRSQSSILPLKLQNFMVAQSLEGSQAFKLVVKRSLRNSDPEKTIHSPFEGYHTATSSVDVDSDIEIVKAIVASRSRLVDRLLPFRDYKFALLSMDETQQDTNEKVVKLLANIFDRFFGVCYRLDAKYCNDWAEQLIEFYLQNAENEKLFEQLFRDCIFSFRQAYAGLKFDKFKFKWDKREAKSADIAASRRKKKDALAATKKKRKDAVAKSMVKDVRTLLADSTPFRGKSSV